MDIKKITQFTKVFPYLFGLRLLPISLLYFLLAAKQIQWIPEWNNYTFILYVILLFISYGLIHLYYIKSYGKVVPEVEPSKDRVGIIIIIIWVYALIFETSTSFPISLSGVMFACFIIYYSFLLNPRPYISSFIFFMMILALILISIQYFATPNHEVKIFDMKEPIWNLFIGIVVFVGGILDHLYLTKNMQPIRASRHE